MCALLVLIFALFDLLVPLIPLLLLLKIVFYEQLTTMSPPLTDESQTSNLMSCWWIIW